MTAVTVSGDGMRSLFELLGGSVPGALCGGAGTCGKCRVRCIGSAPAASDAEQRVLSAEELSSGIRLACLCFPAGPVTVQAVSGSFPEYSAVVAFSGSTACDLPGSPCPERQEKGYGIAVDLGTTTIALALIHPGTGENAGTVSLMNSQRKLGADVLSRIEAACAGAAADLQAAAIRDLDSGIDRLIRKTGIRPSSIRQMVVAANTVMCHLLLGLPACGLGRSPFVPHSLRFEPVSFSSLAAGVSAPPALAHGTARFPVSVLPCADAFVGSDVIAGIAACGAPEGPLPAVYIDLGTNAEIVLLDGKRVWCASAAAGPAFEGAHVSCGCGSLPGAVSAVSLNGSRFAYERIPDPRGNPEQAPPGICGTGLLDFLACALDAGLVRPDGSLARVCEQSGIILDPELPFRLTGADVRELQLAVAAVRAGLAVLLEKAGITASEVARVYLAGGFGFYLSGRSAVRTGLLDRAFEGKIVTPGNASLGGAVRSLCDDSLAGRIHAILDVCESVPLAAESGFNRYFIDSMEFPNQ